MKVGSISAYYRKLASELSIYTENRDKLVEAYLKYAAQVEKETEKSLAGYKRKSYNRKRVK